MVIVVDRILIWPPGGLLLVYMSYMVPSPEIPQELVTIMSHHFCDKIALYGRRDFCRYN